MRFLLLGTIALFGLAGMPRALAQTFAHEPGTGQSGPASDRASNIDAADSHSAIAPHLPPPPAGETAGPYTYLRDAEQALSRHRTGAAQQALEMAETRLLDRVTPATEASHPDQGEVVQQVSRAREALGHGDLGGARAAIAAALTHAPQAGEGDMEMHHGQSARPNAGPP